MRHVVVAHGASLLTLELHLLLVHLETVEARVVDLARLTLRAEVAVTRHQLGDAAVEARVALRHHLLRLLQVALQILNAHLQDGDQVVLIQSAEVWITL